jgi:hypothetical protein
MQFNQTLEWLVVDGTGTTGIDGNQAMKSIGNIPYVLFMAILSAGGLGCVMFFLGRTLWTTSIWWLPFAVTAAGVAFNVATAIVGLNKRSLPYSATVREFGAATLRNNTRGGSVPPAARWQKSKPAFAVFNSANGPSLRRSYFFYLASLLAGWTASFFLIDNSTMAFAITATIFVAAHVVRITQLKVLPFVSFGFVLNIGTMFVTLAGLSLTISVFFWNHSKVGFPLNEYWYVTLSFVLLSFMTIHADFAIASLFRRSDSNEVADA